MDNITQDFDQAEVFVSSREGAVLIRSMPTIHASRAYGKLLEAHGRPFAKSELGRALRTRANLEHAVATNVHSFRSGHRMLRDPYTGRFAGTWSKQQIHADPTIKVFRRTVFEYRVEVPSGDSIEGTPAASNDSWRSSDVSFTSTNTLR